MDFLQWVILIVVVVAIWNAERIPAVQKILQDIMEKLPKKAGEAHTATTTQTQPVQPEKTISTQTPAENIEAPVAPNEKSTPEASAAPVEEKTTEVPAFSLDNISQKADEETESFLNKYTKK